MHQPPALSVEQVRDLVGAEAIRRAQPYVQRHALLQTRRVGGALQAVCEGSRQEPYRVHVRFDPHGTPRGHCTCPVGVDGQCKHVAATLLQWAIAPQAFRTLEDPHTLLAARTREELEAIVLHALRWHPELEVVLHMRFPSSPQAQGPPDAEPYRAQAEAALRPHLDGLAAASQVVAGLQPLFALAAEFDAADDPTGSATVHAALVRALLTATPQLRDEGGPLQEALEHALGGLLATTTDARLDPQLRHDALVMLLEVVLLDPSPELTARAERLLLEYTTPAERQTLAAQLRLHLRDLARDLPSGQHEPDHPLLLRLERETIAEDAFITRCRALGLTDLLVGHLLKQARIAEAADVATDAEGDHLIALIDAFTIRGHADAIEQVVRARYTETADLRLLSWLHTRHIERGDTQAALAAAQAMFWRDPTLAHYLDVRACAVDAELWTMLRPGMLATLRERGATAALIHAHLADANVEAAFNALEQARRRGVTPADTPALRLAIAEGATLSHPALAADLLAQEAQRLIEQRSLSTFARAARHLRDAHDLLASLAAPDPAWAELYAARVAPYLHLQGLADALTDAEVPTPNDSPEA